MMSRNQLNASAYGAKNVVAIVNLRSFVKDLYTRLALVDSDFEIFTFSHVKEAMNHLRSTFKDKNVPSIKNVARLLEE